jgi:hypothetical protein
VQTAVANFVEYVIEDVSIPAITVKKEKISLGIKTVCCWAYCGYKLMGWKSIVFIVPTLI